MQASQTSQPNQIARQTQQSALGGGRVLRRRDRHRGIVQNCISLPQTSLNYNSTSLNCIRLPYIKIPLNNLCFEELHDIEKHATPCSGTCGGMFTANTMAAFNEAHLMYIYIYIYIHTYKLHILYMYI